MSNMFDIFRFFGPADGSIKVMTLHVSKGLEFLVVALVVAGAVYGQG